MKKIMLIDGNSIINRAFFGLPALTTSTGLYTNGILGFLNIFFKLYEEEQPNYLGVAFDLKGPTIRHQKFEAYKGTRKGMPEELKVQMPVLKEVLQTMGIPIFESQGYEADDLLGTLAKKSEAQDFDVVLISGDRDLLQIASERIKIRIPKTKGGKTEIEDYYAKDVEALYGVTPTEFIDVKALMGDASDNIPGVPGIGEKTAGKIIATYKTLENALANYADITPKRMGEALFQHQDLAFLSRDLATIIIDAPVEVPEKAVLHQDIFNPVFREKLKALEFKALVVKHFRDQGAQMEEEATIPVPTFTHQLVTSAHELSVKTAELITLKQLGMAMVNFEETIQGLGLAYQKEAELVSLFVPFETVSPTETLEILADVLNGPSLTLIGADSKQILNFAMRQGHTIQKIAFDTVIASYILNDSAEMSDIGGNRLSITYKQEIDLAGKGKGKRSFEALTSDEKASYGGMDALIALCTYEAMASELEAHQQHELYYDMELPLARVLAEMEVHGVKIDRMGLVDFDHRITQDLERLTIAIHEQAGEDFNINSPAQMGSILFEKLGLKGGKKNKTGYSTAADVLEKLKTAHPIVPLILDYRTISKLKSTYCEGLLKVTHPETDKIHSTFNQVLASTGRISSTEPNLQNIPIRTELGRELRKIFIPTDESYVFLDADYSQIELRILAHLANDPIMIAAYQNGDDIHRITASQVLGIPVDEVTDAQRSSAKAVNFGIIYGMGSFSLSQDLGITKKEADGYIEMYFNQYPNVKAYLESSIESAKEKGYGLTIFGRRRNIPELKSHNFIQRGFGERIAMNMPIQGSAADIIKIAMVRVSQRLKAEGLASRLILTVHDELILETKRDEIDQAKKLLKEEMEAASNLSVPMLVEVKVGETWFDAK